MRAALILLSVTSAFAGQFSISMPVKAIAHPVATFKSIPKDRGWQLATDLVLATANYVDYQTTYQGPVLMPGQFCENNPVLVTSKCVISAPRFNLLKGAVFGVAIAQWIPPLNHYPNWWIPINGALSVPLVIADIGNLKALSSVGLKPVLTPYVPK